MNFESISHGSTKLWIILFITISTFTIYGQVGDHNFVNYDDTGYLITNNIVKAGITPTNIAWAFSTFEMSNWHPLTWLSYMLDIQLLGFNPGAMLLENVAIHTLNSILLFLLIFRLTGELWRSASVAVLFASHPLHVESVAWISERKDLLSTLFLITTLYFYVRYSTYRKLSDYMMVLITFSLGLLAKPMLVTLPVLLLLIDYWPLQRTSALHGVAGIQVVPIRRLFVEKIPFILLGLASSAITLIAQQNALASLERSPLLERISNSLNTYLIYLGEVFWPVNLSPAYPFPTFIPLWQPIASIIAITLITILFLQKRKQHPYLIIGWLWYLITLLPVIGIIRVGVQAKADRYTYIPLIGIFIILVWSFAEISGKWRFRGKLITGISITTFVAFTVISYKQVSYWKNTTTLFSRAIVVTNNNFTAYNLLGGELESVGKYEEALDFYDKAISAEKRWEYSYINKARCLEKLGRVNEAVENYAAAIELKPQSPTAHISMGRIFLDRSQPEIAMSYLRDVINVEPKNESAQHYLALSLLQTGRVDEAVEHYQQSLAINPLNTDSHNQLGIALAQQSKYDLAITHFKEALRLKPDFEEARKNMKTTLDMKSAKK